MLPSSHVFPMNPMGGESIPSPQLLADAFSEFISASSVLEASYRDLQGEVTHLNTELAKRNAELTRSLAENDRIRAALQRMLDSMPCGVVVISSGRRIVMINPEARKLLDLGEVEVGNLRDLSRFSKIDFESLCDGLDERAIARFVSIQGQASAGWRLETENSSTIRRIQERQIGSTSRASGFCGM